MGEGDVMVFHDLSKEMSLCGTILFRIEDLWNKKSMGMRSKLKQFPANKNFDLI